MENIAEKSSRALDATSDLRDLLRLAHEALHRIKQDVHGNCYDGAEVLSLKLHDLRNEADKLSEQVNQYVREAESQVYNTETELQVNISESKIYN